MSMSSAHPLRYRMRLVLLVATSSAAACASSPAARPAAPPGPASRPAPSASRRDTATASTVPPASVIPPAHVTPGSDDRRAGRARATTSSVASPSGPAPAARVRGSRTSVARLSARNDTIAVSKLHGTVMVCAGGDVTLGTNLDKGWSTTASADMRARFGASDEPAALLAPLRPIVSASDILLLNIESAIGEGRTASKCGVRSTNCFAFRSPPAAAPALRALTAGAVVGNIANNHARDAGDDGVDRTIATLRGAGILVTGADTLATPVRTAAGDTIGVLGFYTSSDTPDARDVTKDGGGVARAAKRYPVVIATMHLGAEGRGAQQTLDQREIFLQIDRGNPVAFADAAVRGGAALVVGHGPHVLRGMEWRDGGALIAYSLGNLLTYGPFVLKEPANRGGVLCATIGTNGRVRGAMLLSTMQVAPGVLSRDPSRRAVHLVDSLSRLDFPRSGIRADRDGMLHPGLPPD
jgi:hypothetical protein